MDDSKEGIPMTTKDEHSGAEAKLTVRRVSRRQFMAWSAAGFTGAMLLKLGNTMPAFAARTEALADEAGSKTIVAGWASGPNGLDPEFHYTLRSIGAYRNCSAYPAHFAPKLVGQVYDRDFSKILPKEAKEWKIADDWTSIAITLKEGVMSPMGNELTADDAIWKFQRNWGLKGTTWGFLRDALLMESADQVTKEGKYTFTIHSKSANALLENILAHWNWFFHDSAEYKKHATADDPWATKWAGSNYAGHGAWMITEYTPGQSWTYERNPKYYTQEFYTGNVQKVINKIIPSSTNRVALLESGSIDFAFDLAASELKKLEKTQGVRVDTLPGNKVQYLGFNFAVDSPLKDLNVRQAIGYALPYDELIQRPYLGMAQRMTTTVAPSYAGYDVTKGAFDHSTDLAKAKEYMAKSATPKGFKTTLHYDIGMIGQEETAILIKSALAQIGIEVEIVKVQTGDFFNLAFGGQGFPGMFIYQDMCGAHDVNFGTHLWLKKDHCCAPGKYDNPEIDKLYAEAQGSPADFQKRASLQRQIDTIAFDTDPMGVPMQVLGFNQAARDTAGGWTWYTLNEVIWDGVWKK
jgi:peptide/nickel transport system substrate-binding protein